MQWFAVPLPPGEATICGFVAAATGERNGRTIRWYPTIRKTVEDRLDSWKEIAAYLKRDVTTVQRWEKREGMPVHRHLHDRMGSVYASRAELDAWTRSRNLRGAKENGNDALPPDPSASAAVSPASTSRSRWTFVLLLLLAVGTLAIGAILWFHRTEYFWRNPIADARFQTVTEFDGLEQAAALSRDGHFVAFLSDHDGQMECGLRRQVRACSTT